MPKSPPLAFSYIRFSSAEQGKGDSIRRQEELRDAWLQKAGAVLDTSLSLRDEGVSAFTGRHRENPDRNALAAFLEMVQRGRVPKGSYLVIENLDRLSREHVQPALMLVLNLLQSGIRIVQLKPTEMVFDDRSEMMPLMMALVELSRGNSESQMKSERVGAAWRRKKVAAAEQRPQTRLCPAWLRVEGKKVENYRFVVDESKAEAVRTIYRMAGEGYGTVSIARRLNAEGVPPIARAKHWSQGYVSWLLTSRAPLGEFQPHKMVNGKRVPDGEPVPDYFPAIISEDTWQAVRAAVTSRRHKGGRPTTKVNVFSGLLRDARSGESLVIAPKGKMGGEHRRLVPSPYIRGLRGTVYATFSIDVLERALLGELKEVDPRDVLPPGNDAADKVLSLTGKLAHLEGRIEKLKAKILGEDDLDSLIGPLRELEARRQAVAEELAGAKREASSPLSESWGEYRGLLDALDAAPDPEGARVRLRSVLRRMVSSIHCVFAAKGRWRLAAVQVWFTGDGSRSYLILHRPQIATPKHRHKEQTHVCSFADVAPAAGDLDLRKLKDAAKVVKLLESLDVAALNGKE